MATLSMAFDIASNALQADQCALDIVSNNVANASTPGYTREIANWEQSDPVTINEIAYGHGARVSGPLSQRDRVLEQSLQQQNQVASSSSARVTALNQLQSIFSQANASSSSSSSNATNGISQDISAFFDSLSGLESNPSDNSLRQQVLTSTQNLAGDFQSASSRIAEQQTSLDQQSASLVNQINALTQSIAKLNIQIQSSSPNADAGTLEDHRQQDISNLSQLIGIHQIRTEDNGLTITTSGGALLVSEGQSYPVSTGPSGGVTHLYDAEGNDITGSLASGGGQIGGLLMVRDQDIPQVQSTLDTLAFDLGSAVNTANQTGSDANGNSGVAIFNLPPTSVGAASKISVAITNPAQIAAAAPGLGPSDDTNLLAMANLANQSIVAGATPANYFSDFISALGSLVSEVQTQNTAQQASATQLQNLVNSLSSVNLNEEASAMNTLEQSYQAAAKVFTILSNVMTAALNLGLPTTYAS